MLIGVRSPVMLKEMFSNLAIPVVGQPLVMVIICPDLVHEILVLIFPMPLHETVVTMLTSVGMIILSFPF